MRRRAATGNIVSQGGEGAPHNLLPMQPRREGRICFRLVELKKQYLRTIQAQQLCMARSNTVALLMEKMLAWSGRLTPDELRVQKQKLAMLHLQQQQLTLQQKSLMCQLAQLQSRQHELMFELHRLIINQQDILHAEMAPVSHINAFQL
ncbi:hypothetical protein [Pantoea sp. B65]|uniref:hypothetical protein n=1 Tax=Pantoea sp. B65 TaxID=2813359 RepID=UPI0039B554C8